MLCGHVGRQVNTFGSRITRLDIGVGFALWFWLFCDGKSKLRILIRTRSIPSSSIANRLLLERFVILSVIWMPPSGNTTYRYFHNIGHRRLGFQGRGPKVRYAVSLRVGRNTVRSLCLPAIASVASKGVLELFNKHRTSAVLNGSKPGGAPPPLSLQTVKAVFTVP